MSRLIDADAVIGRWCGMKCGCEREECGREIEPCIVVMAIEEAPTIDAVEVVRCKDCKWRKACKVFSQQQITDDSYCSWGEREGE